MAKLAGMKGMVIIFLAAMLTGVLFYPDVKAANNTEHERVSFLLSGSLWKCKGFYEAKEEDIGITGKWYLPGFNDSSWAKKMVPDEWWCKNKNQWKKEYYAWYRKDFSLPSDFKNKVIFLKLSGVEPVARVWINGNYLGEHCGGSSSFEFEITKYVNFDKPNIVAIRVFAVSSKSGSYALLNKGASWLPRAGLYGKIECLGLPEVYVKKTLIDTDFSGALKMRISINNSSGDEIKNALLFYELKDHANQKIISNGKINFLNLPAGRTTCNFETKIATVMPWSPQSPQLYDISLYLKKAENKKTIDIWKDTIGFRTFEVKGRKFYLNGKEYFIHGTSRGFRPGIRETWSKNINFWRKEWNWLKEQNMDFFRAFCSGAPEEAYQAADEVGIMILQTTTSWIGPRTVGTTKDLLKRFAPRVKNECIEIIERDYNHPCIVGYALSNEAWKGAYIPLFNELYDLSKSICPWRPILTISGVSPHSRGWENLKSDISSLHSYHGWYLGPRQVIADETKKFKNTKQPHILPEKVGAYLSSQHEIWRRWIGDKRHMDLAAREEYLARSIKEIAEHQRMHRDVYAGAMIFSNFERYRHEKYVNPGIKGKAAFNSTVKPTVAKVFSPVLVCADTFADHSNYFAGKEMRFNLYAINDYQKRNIAGAKIRIKLVGNPDNVLFASNEEVGDLPGNSLKKFPIRMSIPPDAVTGFYGLKFSIEEDGKSLNNNSYSVFIMNKKDIPSRIETNKRILLLKSQILAEILDSLSISYDSWKPQRKLNQLDKTEFKEKLKNHDILIISPNTLNWISSLSTGNSIIPEFVAGGGKILCLEQEFNLFKGWLPQNLELNKADITKSTFVDVRNEFHPVFKDLSWKNFDTWNGNKGIIADGILSPLPKEKEVLLATVVPGGACSGGVYPQRAVILNYRYGRGEYLLSQIKALKRYGKDPVATKYLTNILEYVLTQEPYFKARKQYDINIVEDIGDGPFSPDKNGFIRYWLVCGPFPNPGGRLSYHSVTGIGSSGTGLDKDFFASSGGEQNLMPVEGMTQTANFYNTKEGYWMEDVQLPVSRIDCSWNKIKSSNYSVGLNFPYFSTNIIGYAACYIESPEDRKAKVKIGSDDGYKFYLNHKMAGKLNKVRGIKIDDNIHNILLKKGLNTLLIAISQDVGGFGFCLRFTDMNDKPLTDLKIWLAPNK